ncbi:hypothetical protein, partial [Mesorhizobium sp. M0408]|uniref:hypothetical protein n=1 Tax=Mesorhizobium sp. M0408 TaxID=2956942 RepID=UPI003337011C
MNMDYREFKEPVADAIEAELALLGPGTLPRRTILSSNNRTRLAKSICAPSDAANFFRARHAACPTASQAHRDEFGGCEGGDEKIMVVSLGRPLEQGSESVCIEADVASDLDLEIGSGSGDRRSAARCHVPSAAHRRWSGSGSEAARERALDSAVASERLCGGARLAATCSPAELSSGGGRGRLASRTLVIPTCADVPISNLRRSFSPGPARRYWLSCPADQ